MGSNLDLTSPLSHYKNSLVLWIFVSKSLSHRLLFLNLQPLVWNLYFEFTFILFEDKHNTPLHFSPEPVLLVPLFTQAPSNLLSVQEILHWIWSGIDLDQITFSEGHITFCHLQAINHIDNPQFYSDLSNAVDKDSESRFREDRDSEGEEPSHLQPTLAQTELSNLQPTQDSKTSSIGLRPIPFRNNNQWHTVGLIAGDFCYNFGKITVLTS